MLFAFKEWALVCEAIGTGQQNLLIRKGGIAEGRDGFAFKEKEFLLFPTWFHEQLEKTTLPSGTLLPAEPEGEIEICYAVTVEWTQFITDLDVVKRLRRFHILQDSVLDERFYYKGVHGVHVALVRAFRLEPVLQLQLEKRFGGCRSWIELPEQKEHAFVSVLSDEEHAQRKQAIESALGL